MKNEFPSTASRSGNDASVFRLLSPFSRLFLELAS